MALEIVFQNNLAPDSENLSTRFIDATGFYIAAPFLSSEYQIDVYLQLYLTTQTDEQVRVLSLGTIEEKAVWLNIIDTERFQTIPTELLSTGVEMALLFLSSDETFIQAAIVKPECTISDVCSSLSAIEARLTAIENALNSTPVENTAPTQSQQQFFGLQ